ncbi:helix-turn-helix domain-containing protein [Gordonia sp. SND2]|uniref:helix-turn-helix domain-containing protein n=1 Tax=Gordonia sp. SND2 TaxID=3388659 RepID=UPI00398B31BB
MSTCTSTPDLRRGFFVAVLVGCLVLSMGGNALHEWAAWHADVAAGIDRGGVPVWVPVIVIALFPAMVVVMTETAVITYKRTDGPVRGIVTICAAVVGVIALAVSYSGLVYVADVILGLPVVLAYAAPLIVDVPIIAATLALWNVVDRARALAATDPTPAMDVSSESALGFVWTEPVASGGHDRAYTPESTGAMSTVSTGRDRVDSPESSGSPMSESTVYNGGHDQAESTMDSDVDLLESTESTAVSTTGFGAESSGRDDMDAPESTGRDDVYTGESSGPESTVSTGRDQVDPPESIVDTTAPESTESAMDAAVDVVVDSASTQGAERPSLRVVAAPEGSLAERVVARVGGDVDAGVVAEALRLRDEEEMSLRRIADTLGVGSHSTVRKWLKVAEDLDDEADTA